MDNRKKKKNKQKGNQNPNTSGNTEALNTEAENQGKNTEHATENTVEKKKEDQDKNHTEKKTENKNTKEQSGQKKQNEKQNEQQRVEGRIEGKTNPEPLRKTVALQKAVRVADSNIKSDKGKSENKNQKENVANVVKEASGKKEFHQKESDQKETKSKPAGEKPASDVSSEQIQGMAINAAKILLPVAACAIIIAVVISYIASQRESRTVNNPALNTEEHTDTASLAALSNEPLAENAYADVNELMQTFCTALADGDIDTVRAVKDYNTDREIVTYEKKSEFIEKYDNIKCYTKPGVEENSYFVYVTYEVKFKDIETEAPGLNAFYVYTAEDGSLKIDGDTEENIKAAFKLVTNQDDVVDLYNKINVDYTKATTADEQLNQFMEDLPVAIKESVGVALAQLEAQGDGTDTPETDTPQSETGETQTAETSDESEEIPQNQVVNQIVRTTDTVNVRSSDSEEADKVGKAQAGTELRRIEDRVNGWSKVIFEDKEAYIKSDYLEVVTVQETTTEVVGTVTATTNVNVRSQASQESDRIGSAQTGTSYSLLEDQGEWYKIDYNGTTGYVKAEFFVK